MGKVWKWFNLWEQSRFCQAFRRGLFLRQRGVLKEFSGKCPEICVTGTSLGPFAQKMRLFGEHAASVEMKFEDVVPLDKVTAVIAIVGPGLTAGNMPEHELGFPVNSDHVVLVADSLPQQVIIGEMDILFAAAQKHGCQTSHGQKNKEKMRFSRHPFDPVLLLRMAAARLGGITSRARQSAKPCHKLPAMAMEKPPVRTCGQAPVDFQGPRLLPAWRPPVVQGEIYWQKIILSRIPRPLKNQIYLKYL
jgi:hypothetical protein